jgi:Tfp pilus assembly protein PilN
MKNDINLLYKRKTKTYSNKKVLAIVLLLVLLAAGMYAGIALPSSALRVAKLKAAELENKLSTSSQTQQELTDKSLQNALLSLQLTELKAIDELRSDVTSYFEAIERAQPTEVAITNLSMSKRSMNISGSISGIPESDKIVATFCLRLREQNVFSNVYLSKTTTEDNDICTFMVYATLPSPLDSETLIKAIEQKDDVTAVPTSEVSN